MRILTILFIFVLSLYSKPIKDSIITDFAYSTDGRGFVSIQEIDDFIDDEFTLRFTLNLKVLKDEKYYLRMMVNSDYIKSSSYKYIIKNDYPVMELDKNMPNEIFVTFDYQSHVPLLQVHTFSQFEYEYIYTNEKIIFGLTYGIMFCALLYNLAFYYFNRQKSFLFYSSLQFFSIGLLSLIAMPVKLFYFIFQYMNIFDILVNLIIIFSILFSMEFLNTKKLIPKIHKALVFMLILTFVDIPVILFTEGTILYKYIPTFVPIGILLFSAFFIVKKGYKPAIFYITGWMVLFVSVFIVDMEYFDVHETYLLHFAFPLEALIFSFAIGYKVKLMDLEKQQSEQLLIHQSKLASMGEMVANIAHQWRQPLTHLSYVNMNLKAAYDSEKLTPAYFDKKSNEINEQIEFMSSTINDFRNFFKIDKKIEKFGVLDSFENTYSLLNASFKHSCINVNVHCEKELFVKSYKSEFSQVVFNILNNAKQALVERKVSEPCINVEIKEYRKKLLLTISDNALGIESKILDKVFEPYFTTKEEGMGIGLYMSKVIIEQHMKGRLSVKNISNGVSFEISLPLIK